MSRLARALAIPVVAASLSCASSRASGPPPPAAVWPLPPEPPAVRLIGILPDSDLERRATPWWRKLLGWITGVDPRSREDGTLVRPFAVALDGSGGVIVADPDAGRVLRLGATGERRDLSCKGRGWGAPMALARAADESLYVADAAEGVVVHWRDGDCETLGAGLLERPTGIAVATDKLWIADPPRHQIVALTLQGAAVARIGEPGAGEGHFYFPTSVTRAPDGTLLVVDSLNFRIVRLAADGRWLGAFGAPGDADAGLSRPKAVVAGEGGAVFVSDAQRDAVIAFSPSGEYLYAIGTTGADPGQFAHPAGLDSRDAVLAIADSQNRRIQLFAILKERQ